MKLTNTHHSDEFKAILVIIQAGRSRAFEAVNVALIKTYWAIGEQLSGKVSEAGWGKGVVADLASWLAAESPDLKGFSSSNLWRMKQFFETYAPLPKLATLLRELSWSKHLLLMSSCKSEEEKEFYLRESPSLEFKGNKALKIPMVEEQIEFEVHNISDAIRLFVLDLAILGFSVFRIFDRGRRPSFFALSRGSTRLGIPAMH